VEDDAQIARIVQIKLKNKGYVVAHATDGGAGLDLIREERPNLVLLDIMMPVMDGYTVLRSLRADPELVKIPVIMLSAKGQERDILQGLEGGAVDYVVKPFSPSELVARVQRHLNQ
ncbi:MAG TPA: response regulator, partial [Symbiobacteriaceae bacterium]|nr:response regulator [Symbiobacteriaceae bacterium]